MNAAQLAAGELSGVADAFANAGHAVRLPARGILQVVPPGPAAARRSLLVSVGVHGDETAPIALLAELLAAFAAVPSSLRVNLMVVVGNLAAIAAGRRYIETDMNRLFARERAGRDGAEGERADAILRATDAFFAQPCCARWHLDLHTAIRASRFETFAIVPDVMQDGGREALLDWLARAHIGAAVLNRQLSATYSAYSAQVHGAIACTAELGRVGPLGGSDLAPFRPAQAALAALMSEQAAAPGAMPLVFEVAQEIVKHSAAFRFAFDPQEGNFMPVAPGAPIAEDGAQAWHAGEATEYAVFPNPDVAPGKRAALMVVEKR